MRPPNKEAADAWREIERLPEFKNATSEGKKDARRHWREQYGLDKPEPVKAPQAKPYQGAPLAPGFDKSKLPPQQSPAQMMAQDPAAQARRNAPVPQPATAPKPIPQLPQRNAVRPDMPATVAGDPKAQQYGPPSPLPPWVMPEDNALLTGATGTATYKASELYGHPLLPPEVTQALRPVEGVGNKIISALPAVGETLVTSAGLAPALGPWALPAASGLLSGVRNTADVQAGRIDAGQGLDNVLLDTGSAALFPMLDKVLPSGTIAKTAMSEGIQGLVQTELDAQLRGTNPGVEDLVANTLLGLGTRGLMGGMRPELAQAQQMGRRALDAVQRPVPLGDLAQQRGAIDFTQRPDADGGQIPPRPPQAAPAAQPAAPTAAQQTKVIKLTGAHDSVADALGLARPGHMYRGVKDEAAIADIFQSGSVRNASGDPSFFAPDAYQRYVFGKHPRGYIVETDADASMFAPLPAGADAFARSKYKQATGPVPLQSVSRIYRLERADVGTSNAPVRYEVIYDRDGGIGSDNALSRINDPNASVSSLASDPAVVSQRRAFLEQRVSRANQEIADLEQQAKVPGLSADDLGDLRYLITEARDRASKAQAEIAATAQPRISEAADRPWDNAGNVVPPPPRPPQAAAAAGGAGDPPRPPSAAAVPAPDAPTPPPGQFAPTPPTPAMQRVFGDDVANLRNEPRQAAKDMAEALDNPARPASDPAAVQAATDKADDYYNFRRAGLSDGVEQAMRQRIGEVVAENGWNPKQRVGFDQVRAEAAEIDPALLRELTDKPPKDGETLHPAVRLAARENLGAISKEIYDLRRKLESPAIKDEMRANLEDQANRLETDAKRLLDVLIPTRSQDGRNLAYHAIIAKNGFDASYWVGRAQKLYRGDLPADTRGRLMDLAEQGQRAKDAGDEAGARTARIELAKELTKLQKSTRTETFLATMKAGLLTAPNTHFKNVTGNASFQIAEEIARLPAALVDMAIANTPGLKRIGSGQRTISGIDPKAIANASAKGAAKGWKEFKEIMRYGATDDALSKFELPRELNSGSKWLDTYVNGVFRSLNAEDRLFRQVAIRRSLEDQARVVAINEAKADPAKRSQIRQRQNELVEKPTDAMMAQAIGDAELATFTNDNVVATALSRGKRAIAGNPAGDALNFMVDVQAPFVKTPTNILARLMDYGGPGGLLRGAFAAKKRMAEGRKLFSALTPAEQRGVSQAIGRGAVGWGLILLGKHLASKGLATGSTAEEEGGVRGANQIAGRQEGSIKIGGRWQNISGLAPVGQLIAIGATFHEQGDRNSSDPLKAAGKVAAAGTQVMLDQPMLQGVDNVQDILKDPFGQGGRAMASYGSMLVPSAVSAVADQFDDKARQRFDKTAGPVENFSRGVASRLPGARNLLPEATDPFGGSLEQSPVPVIDFLRSTGAREDTDPLASELVRLKVDVRPPMGKLNFKGADGKEAPYQLSPGEHNEYKAMFGKFADEEMSKAFDKPGYADMSDDDKNHEIEKALSKAKRDATKEFKQLMSEVLGIPTP